MIKSSSWKAVKLLAKALIPIIIWLELLFITIITWDGSEMFSKNGIPMDKIMLALFFTENENMGVHSSLNCSHTFITHFDFKQPNN